MEDTQLHLRWHSHSLTFIGMLHDLHSQRTYTDVSLICDGGVVRAHRAVLSLSSPYLASVFETCNESYEAPLLLPEIPIQDIRYLISFIYRGQVDVPQTHIASFLNTGKHLQVLGLEQGDQLVHSPEKSEESTPPPSDAEEEPAATKRPVGNNNNNIETRPPLDTSEAVKSPDKIRNGDLKVKMEVERSIKLENIKTEDEPLTEGGKIDLNYYLQQAIQSASMPCPLCKKEFKSQSGLRDHIRLHTGERPFVCDFCNMNFARASHLKRHRRMHTGEKPFECSVCGKDFSRGDKLKDHLRRHDAESKIQQIRTQILSLEDSPSEGEFGGIGSMGVLPGGSSSNGNSLISSCNTSITPINPITPLTTVCSPSQLFLSKFQSAPFQDVLQPPAKKPCINPKTSMGQGTPFSHVMTHIPNLIAAQENSPQPLGVASIGECILRPIN